MLYSSHNHLTPIHTRAHIINITGKRKIGAGSKKSMLVLFVEVNSFEGIG